MTGSIQDDIYLDANYSNLVYEMFLRIRHMAVELQQVLPLSFLSFNRSVVFVSFWNVYVVLCATTTQGLLSVKLMTEA